MLLKTTGKEYGEPLPKQTAENREKKTAHKMCGRNMKAVKTSTDLEAARFRFNSRPVQKLVVTSRRFDMRGYFQVLMGRRYSLETSHGEVLQRPAAPAETGPLTPEDAAIPPP